jgi:ribosomal protein S14
MALPKPYQPGSIKRHCAQENTHGIARRSSMARVFLREAGRLPMFSVEISLMTVDSQK